MYFKMAKIKGDISVNRAVTKPWWRHSELFGQIHTSEGGAKEGLEEGREEGQTIKTP